MTPTDQLSEHDRKLLKQIETLDRERGWSEWPAIASLASQLEDEERKSFWNRCCSHYNHLEEASIGEL